jgi:hypothetical protein
VITTTLSSYNTSSSNLYADVSQGIYRDLHHFCKRSNNFHAKLAESSDAVKEIISSSIQNDAIVGGGDSATVRQLGIIRRRAIFLFSPFFLVAQSSPSDWQHPNALTRHNQFQGFKRRILNLATPP